MEFTANILSFSGNNFGINGVYIFIRKIGEYDLQLQS